MFWVVGCCTVYLRFFVGGIIRILVVRDFSDFGIVWCLGFLDGLTCAGGFGDFSGFGVFGVFGCLLWNWLFWGVLVF